MNRHEAGGLLVCTFLVDDLLLGIDVRDVQEVLREVEVTPVPHSPAAVSGLINLRGQIATTIDLRSRLGVPPSDGVTASTHVVVRHAGEQMSLLVDRIGEVIEVDHDLYEPPPVTMAADIAQLITGTYKLVDGLLVVLDVGRIVALDVVPGEEAA